MIFIICVWLFLPPWFLTCYMLNNNSYRFTGALFPESFEHTIINNFDKIKVLILLTFISPTYLVVALFLYTLKYALKPAVNAIGKVLFPKD